MLRGNAIGGVLDVSDATAVQLAEFTQLATVRGWKVVQIEFENVVDVIDIMKTNESDERIKPAEIVRAKGGAAEQTVSINQIVVPDLWHIAMGFPEGSREREMILETWHLAHDLKRHIEENE